MKSTAKIALALLGAAVLCLGTFGAVANAGKTKKKTVVIYFSGSPKINSKGGKVTAKGGLNTASACKPSRGIRLQVLNSSSVVIATIDGTTTDSSGNWSVNGKLPSNLPAGTNYVRVKATKRTVSKFVCKAGVTALTPIPAA
jgi:hypothetical protein